MSYSSPIQDLLREDRLMPLDPGSPQKPFRVALELPMEQLFAPTKIVDRDAALACRAGLWLYFDFLDESHKISQDLETVEGSYWHGILHRREPDYGNAKYWFRRVGRHEAFLKLAEKAAVSLQKAEAKDLAARLIPRGEWDPFAFVDECERAAQLAKQDPRVQLLREIQAL